MRFTLLKKVVTIVLFIIFMPSILGQRTLIIEDSLESFVTITGSSTVTLNQTHTYYASASGVTIYSGS